MSEVSASNLIKNGLLREQDEVITILFNHFNANKLTTYDYWFEIENENDSWRPFYKIKKFNNKCIKLGFEHLIIEVPKSFISVWNERVEYILEKNKELKTPENIEKRLKQKEKRLHSEVIEWRSGNKNTTNAIRSLSPMILRVKGDHVETSRGARVSHNRCCSPNETN